MSDEEMALNVLPDAGVTMAVSTTAGPSTAPATDGEAPLSKKAQKRAAKRAKFEASRPEKRAAERARRRDRAHFLSEGYAAGTLSAEDAALLEKQRELKRARKASSRGVGGDVHPAAVVVDLGFDDLMTEQEITSMHSQLGYVYSINRTAARPFSSVLHTSFSPENSPRLWTKMGKAQWQRWNRMWFTAGDVGDVARELGKKEADGEEGKTEEVKVDEVKQEEASASSPAPTEPAPTEPAPTEPAPYADLTRHLAPTLPPSIPRTHKLVYLSADADEELTTLAADEVYVIGGIVDRNRHKMLCQNKAEGLGIRTARLPIGTYLANMPTRKVLTVNQVFEILSQYLALQDWAAAFEAVIPQRKFFNSKEEKQAAHRAGTGAGAGAGTSEPGDGEGEGDDDDDGEGEDGKAGAPVNEEAINAGDVEMDEEEAMNAHK